MGKSIAIVMGVLAATSLLAAGSVSAETREAGVAEVTTGRVLDPGPRADEITRRLRRMGFQYIEVHNGRPKEVLGQYC